MSHPTIPFAKWHGLGNDFVLIDATLHPDTPAITPELARAICDRRYGIGADQLLWVRPPSAGEHADRHPAHATTAPTASRADARMSIFNPDGTEAEMCGNGIRSVSLHLFHDRKLPTNAQNGYHIETLAGIKSVEIRNDGTTVRVNMGPPVLGGGFVEAGELLPGKNLPSGLPLLFYEVSMGNPHAIFFVKQLDKIPLEDLGAFIEKHERFPKRTNVEFVQETNFEKIRVRVWERGTGVTLACGTGACAAAVAAIQSGRAASPLKVELPGGTLLIEWKIQAQAEVAREPLSPVWMEGPAKKVFAGDFPVAD